MEYILFYWLLYSFFKWSADSVAHHFKTSLYWRWKYFYPDWKRKYKDRDPSKGRKKIWIFVIPALFFDGWHLFVWLQTMTAYTAFVHIYFLFHLNAYLYILVGVFCFIIHWTSELVIYKTKWREIEL